MGLITASNSNEFKSAEFIYAKVRRFLNSFDAAGLIDEGEFPSFTREALEQLGIGVYMEEQAILYMKDGKADLPENFKYLYVAYKCSPIDKYKAVRKHHQPTGFAFTTVVRDQIRERNGCEIDCCEEITETERTISVQNYVTEGDPRNYQFTNVVPLRLSPNVSRDCLIGDNANFLNTSNYEITINNDKLYSNFDDDYIYMKYYGFPITDEGDMLVPNISVVESAIQWYIIYQILLSGWYNSSIPDIQNKAQDAENKFREYKAEAKFFNKFPSFAEMVNTIRTKRGLNKMVYMTNQYSNTNFQRSR